MQHAPSPQLITNPWIKAVSLTETTVKNRITDYRIQNTEQNNKNWGLRLKLQGFLILIRPCGCGSNRVIREVKWTNDADHRPVGEV